MVLNFSEYQKKEFEFYYDDDSYVYSPYNDPSLTYQECVLIGAINTVAHINADMAGYSEPKDIIDMDWYSDERPPHRAWHCFVASFFQPIEVTNEWDQVMTDRRHNNSPQIRGDKEHAYMWQYSALFSVICKERERVKNAKYKDYRIRVNAKVPDYIVEGEVYETKHENL